MQEDMSEGKEEWTGDEIVQMEEGSGGMGDRAGKRISGTR